jgi:hypothetical protein
MHGAQFDRLVLGRSPIVLRIPSAASDKVMLLGDSKGKVWQAGWQAQLGPLVARDDPLSRFGRASVFCTWSL